MGSPRWRTAGLLASPLPKTVPVAGKFNRFGADLFSCKGYRAYSGDHEYYEHEVISVLNGSVSLWMHLSIWGVTSQSSWTALY